MRAMFVGLMLVLGSAEGWGGETIEYSSAEPTLTFEQVLAEAERAGVPTIEVRGSDLTVTRLDDSAYWQTNDDLRAWARRVNDGAASRAELVRICSDAPVVPPGGGSADISSAIVCLDVLTEPYAQTLRAWADRIESESADG